jgi:hypothetical protein
MQDENTSEKTAIKNQYPKTRFKKKSNAKSKINKK